MKTSPTPFLPLAALLLGGCVSLGAPPPVPGVVIPARWQQALPAAPANTSLTDWWRQFDDPLLDALIAGALEAAPDVRAARAQLRQARANRDVQVAALYPSLSVGAAATRSRAGREAGGNDRASTLYDAGFDAGWEPSIFGGQRDSASGALADLWASAASLAATRVSLAAEVALEYVTLRTTQQQLAITRDNVASQEETLRLTEWRQQAGLATMLDVEQARTVLAQSRAQLPALEINRANAAHRLAILTGQPPGTLAERLRAALPLPAAPESIAVAIPADTIRQRPDVHAAELKLLAEQARTDAARAERWPSLNLSGSWGWKAFSAAALGAGGTMARSLAGSLALSLFDGGRLRGRIEAQDAVREQALIAWEASILGALEDVENALVAYARGRERLETRARAATAAINAAELARQLYEAGAIDFRQVLDTQRARLSAEDGLVGAQGDQLAALIRLYKALGGGWQNQDEPS